MRDPLAFWLEHDGHVATLYVRGVLDRDRCASMVDLCASMPLSVRTLQLDAREIGVMSREATEAVREVFAHWQATRGGEFHMSTSYLVVACTPARPHAEHASAMMLAETAALAVA